MGNYDELKQAVSDVIKTNGNQEITGQLMQNTLLSIINTVGANSTFCRNSDAGDQIPEHPTKSVFYISSEKEYIVNFDNL